uniref:Uncharacterized protein n=1 Tax=Romanomermis culicivorax TaxID=13658 RepID=A0A915IVW8_ROMCU
MFTVLNFHKKFHDSGKLRKGCDISSYRGQKINTKCLSGTPTARFKSKVQHKKQVLKLNEEVVRKWLPLMLSKY